MRAWETAVRCGLACMLAHAALRAAAQVPDSAKPETMKKADAAFHEGFAAQQSGNLALAREKFSVAVNLEPKIAEAHEALGAVQVSAA